MNQRSLMRGSRAPSPPVAGWPTRLAVADSRWVWWVGGWVVGDGWVGGYHTHREVEGARPEFAEMQAAPAGSPLQVWFDSPDSLSAKYALAAQLGLRGVGVWHLDCLDYRCTDAACRQATDAMWGALLAFTQADGAESRLRRSQQLEAAVPGGPLVPAPHQAELRQSAETA